MKAWIVKEKEAFCSTVVFAPTRNIAKSVALSSGQLEDATYLYLEAKRYPEADIYYDGNKQSYCLDWCNQDDRLFLVKECGWRCEEFMLELCKDCKAKDYCDDYQDWIDDNEEEEE